MIHPAAQAPSQPMARKLLLVDRSDTEIARLADQLQGGGARVLLASGGLYALTMLEREQPHLLITRFELGDMTGIDLCSLIKRDDLLAGIQVVLLARSLEEKLSAERAGGFDLILIDDRPPSVLAASLKRLIERGLRSPAPLQVASPEKTGEQSIAGTLGVLNFAELSQALSQTGKTGRLDLEIGAPDEPAMVLFDEGRVRHAAFRKTRGTPAFARLYYETERAGGIVFRFEPMTAERIASQPCTIDRSAQQLLLSAAVELDHYNTTELPVISRSEIESLAAMKKFDRD